MQGFKGEKIKAEARAKSQAAVHASDEAKEHANESSAVFGAKSETSINKETRADKKGTSSNGEVKSATKANAKAKKG